MRSWVKLTYSDFMDQLPDGTFVALEISDTPYLVRGDRLFPWSFTGYGRPIARPGGMARVLTPRSTVRTLAHGYHAGVYPSAFADWGL